MTREKAVEVVKSVATTVENFWGPLLANAWNEPGGRMVAIAKDDADALRRALAVLEGDARC